MLRRNPSRSRNPLNDKGRNYYGFVHCEPNTLAAAALEIVGLISLSIKLMSLRIITEFRREKTISVSFVFGQMNKNKSQCDISFQSPFEIKNLIRSPTSFVTEFQWLT